MEKTGERTGAKLLEREKFACSHEKRKGQTGVHATRSEEEFGKRADLRKRKVKKGDRTRLNAARKARRNL